MHFQSWAVAVRMENRIGFKKHLTGPYRTCDRMWEVQERLGQTSSFLLGPWVDDSVIHHSATRKRSRFGKKGDRVDGAH